MFICFVTATCTIFFAKQGSYTMLTKMHYLYFITSASLGTPPERHNSRVASIRKCFNFQQVKWTNWYFKSKTSILYQSKSKNTTFPILNQQPHAHILPWSRIDRSSPQLFRKLKLVFRCFPLTVDVFPSVLVCDPDLFSLDRFMTIEQRYTTVAFIWNICQFENDLNTPSNQKIYIFHRERF